MNDVNNKSLLILHQVTQSCDTTNGPNMLVNLKVMQFVRFLTLLACLAQTRMISEAFPFTPAALLQVEAEV